ncbi:hypothetical protein DKX38_028760 [Salix brachista]|uniref:UvrC family homology region profile domain-containing protein n=1 Tax=Salix brachista TaxID=2182728 RepID=A0A5N5JA28_9ROSI|nr:hypothetical protein DKX38_028760 [Salix brachista]
MGISLHISIVPVIIVVVSLQVWMPLGCFEEERIALLNLKDSLNYPTSLHSWRKGDVRCCDWERVGCSSSTGRVTILYLSGVRNGEMGDWYLNASLFLPFQELIALDLTNNQIAGWVEKKGVYQPVKMSKLEYLQLSYNRLNNSILSYVDGLSSLKSLDISYNRLEGLIDLKECPSNLEALDLSGNNITKVVVSIGPTTLSTLYLNNITAYESNFQTLLQSLGAFPNLTTLGLGYNDLRGRIFGDGKLLADFLNLKNLELLDLSYNTLNSSNIFQTIGMMTSLKTLSFSGCSLNGQLATAQGLCDLNHLQELDISSNDLSGFLPPCLANLTSLQKLNLSSNHLTIPMSLSPLYNLSKLKSFDGSDNKIYAEEDDHNLSPKFQLESLYLSSRGQVAGTFPKFLHHQFNLQSFDLTNIQIKGDFPSWLIENNTYLQELYLENCSLSGPLLLPRSSHVKLSSLSISMNNFHGQIPAEIGVYFPGLEFLMMSDNGFDGCIPFSLGSMSSLQLLDLSNNFMTGRTHSNNSLQGQIPEWIGNMSSLEFLDLSTNNFSGPLPPIFGAFSKLRHVYLSRNKLQGLITTEFYDSYKIVALDLSHNSITGRIPEWIGRLSNLRSLLLSHNNLKGEIPIQLYSLEQLTLIDLSHNYLSGNILSWMKFNRPFPSLTTYYDYVSSSQQSFEFTMGNTPLIYKGISTRLPPKPSLIVCVTQKNSYRLYWIDRDESGVAEKVVLQDGPFSSHLHCSSNHDGCFPASMAASWLSGGGENRSLAPERFSQLSQWHIHPCPLGEKAMPAAVTGMVLELIHLDLSGNQIAGWVKNKVLLSD